MDFDLTDDQKAIQDLRRDFAAVLAAMAKQSTVAEILDRARSMAMA
jgi:hypothetical protein